ncbi:hypothetical protein ACFQZR_12155 [Paenibacillus sp. GCM10027629]|uniref:hypothetical protein n=1 Tax=Paenibacillus sp. GCM10027629 TaxID=3273414 RepID=UPI003631073D
MRRVISIGLIIGFLFLVLIGCNKELTGDEKTAAEYVKAQGFTIISHKGEFHRYTLEKNKLYGTTESIPYRQAWAVQKVEPDKYFGKEIIIYRFIVSNHPLEKINKSNTNVYIMLSEGKVIGGYSFPNIDGLVGSVYSIDGKTLEEVTGMNNKDWLDNWEKKYSS